MKRFLIFAAFILSSVSVNAQAYVDACITANSAPLTGASPKTIWVCRGTPTTLSGENCKSPTPGGYNPSYLSYTWQYLRYPSTVVTLTGKTKVAIDSGRWIVTVRYLDAANGINELDRDTVWIKYYGTSVKVVQKNGAGIAIKCASDSLLLTSTVLPAAAASTVSQYSWYVVGNSTPISNTDKVKVKNVSYYAVTAYESTYGCWIKDTVLVSNYPNPQVNLGPDKSICSGNSVTLASSAAPGVTINLCTWYKDGTVVTSGPPLSSPANTPPSLTTSSAGTFVLYLRAQGTGCSNTDTVLVDSRLGADFSLKDSSICFTDSVQLIPLEIAVVAPATYTWTANSDLDDVNIKTPYANPPANGTFTYYLTVTDANNCPVTKSVSVTKYPQLNSSVLFADSTICTDSSLTLVANNATGGMPFLSGSSYLYYWKNQNKDIIASTQNATVDIITSDSTFYLVVKDSKGCMDSSASIVTIHSTSPEANLGPDVFASGNTTVVLDPHSNGTVGYDWYVIGTVASLGTDPTLSVTTEGEYYVLVKDIVLGCKISDTIKVDFTEGNPELIYVPNAFSPEASNADDKVIKIYGEGVTSDGFEFKIYNRWGDMIYSSNNLSEVKNNGWHGVSDNNAENQQNVFTYSVKGKYVTGKSFEQTGTITLVR